MAVSPFKVSFGFLFYDRAYILEVLLDVLRSVESCAYMKAK